MTISKPRKKAEMSRLHENDLVGHGEVCDYIVVDDPHNTKQVESAVKRNKWWDEALSTRLKNISVNNIITNFAIRREEKQGQNYLVIPIVALVEGVHAGSGGSGFYSSAEINRTAQNWNGVPLTIDHPKDDGGNPVTANNPEMLKKYGVGTFENVHYEQGKLKGEGWINKDRVGLLSPETLNLLRLRARLEVSTGLFSSGDGVAGSWKGERYEETLSDFIPDHLALLPTSEGACNFKDGCGVRMNQKEECKACVLNTKGGGKQLSNERFEIDFDIYDVKERLNKHGFCVNEISHNKVREQLFKLVSDMDKQGTMHFLREVFDNHFVYEEVVGNDSKLYKLGYKVSKEDMINVKGSPEEVKEKVEFISVNVFEGEDSMNRNEEINSLIANEKLSFIEDDREYLKELDNSNFSRLFAVNNCACVEDGDKLKKTLEVNTKLQEEVVVLKEQLSEFVANAKTEGKIENKAVTLDDILQAASPEDREAWNTMKVNEKEKKDNAVKTILELKGNKFTESELQEKTFVDLSNIISLVPIVTNYAGNGSGVKTVKKVQRNERGIDGMGVPAPPKARWNADGTPNYSHLNQ
ncbi:MAG: DUF2213 domain-containing protein [Gammaproteobacteria bacterium]|nr:DUF2213 domain-containing protein [Gammaproteobacteria bacterium]